jgi:hypothetical protein
MSKPITPESSDQTRDQPKEATKAGTKIVQETKGDLEEHTKSYTKKVQDSKLTRDKHSKNVLGDRPKIDGADEYEAEKKAAKSTDKIPSTAASAPSDKYAADIKQFTDDMKVAQESGDYSKVIKDFNEQAQKYKSKEYGKELNAALHEQGLLPPGLDIDVTERQDLGKDMKGLPVKSENGSIHAEYDEHGKLLQEKDGAVAFPTHAEPTLFEQIRAVERANTVSDARHFGDFIQKHYDEIDKNGNGFITEKEIKAFGAANEDKLTTQEKSALEYMKEHKHEFKKESNDKGFDVRGISKQDVQEWVRSVERENGQGPGADEAKQKKQITELASALKEAERTGDYTKVIETYNKVAAQHNDDSGTKVKQFQNALNKDLHAQGLLPDGMEIPIETHILVGKDLKGLPIYSIDSKDGIFGEVGPDGKMLREKDQPDFKPTHIGSTFKETMEEQRKMDEKRAAKSHTFIDPFQ